MTAKAENTITLTTRLKFSEIVVFDVIVGVHTIDPTPPGTMQRTLVIIPCCCHQWFDFDTESTTVSGSGADIQRFTLSTEITFLNPQTSTETLHQWAKSLTLRTTRVELTRKECVNLSKASEADTRRADATVACSRRQIACGCSGDEPSLSQEPVVENTRRGTLHWFLTGVTVFLGQLPTANLSVDVLKSFKEHQTTT